LKTSSIVVERVPLEMPPTATNLRYLQTKHEQLGHLFNSSSRGNERVTSKKGE